MFSRTKLLLNLIGGEHVFSHKKMRLTEAPSLHLYWDREQKHEYSAIYGMTYSFVVYLVLISFSHMIARDKKMKKIDTVTISYFLLYKMIYVKKLNKKLLDNCLVLYLSS